MRHCSDHELVLHFYGEGRRRGRVDQHLRGCERCAAAYQEIAGTLALVESPDVPERGDQYGLEVWQRIRLQAPEPPAPWYAGLHWRGWHAGAAALAAVGLIVAGFIGGRHWPMSREDNPLASTVARHAIAAAGTTDDTRRRILLATVADHLDRSDRVLTDIMNAADGNIADEQLWAEDLLSASRLYRQDALAIDERSVADVLDELERALLEIVHGPARATPADLDQMRRRIDSAALLFKVRVLGGELRQPPASETVRGTRPSSHIG